MEDNNSYTSALSDFAIVEDGHDGQTEEDKREAYAAEESDGRRSVTTAAEPKAEEKETSGKPDEEKKPVLDQEAIDAYIAQGRTQGEADTRQKLEADFAGANVINPTTGKPFASMAEYQSYGKEQLLQRQKQEARDTKRKGQSEDDRLKEIQERDRLVELGRAAEKKAADDKRQANADAELAVIKGKVDAWVIDEMTAAAMVAEYNADAEKKLVILDEAMTTEPYALAFQLGSEDLVAAVNEALDGLVEDGTVASLFEKYEAPYTAPEK